MFEYWETNDAISNMTVHQQTNKQTSHSISMIAGMFQWIELAWPKRSQIEVVEWKSDQSLVELMNAAYRQADKTFQRQHINK